MKGKIVLVTLALIMFAASVSIAKAQIAVSIDVKDSDGDSISGKTVHINTVAYVYGYYEDQMGSMRASAVMEVYYDDGSGMKRKATLYSGLVSDRQTIMKTYTLTELGSYEFRWTCQIGTGMSGMETLCRQERAMARTTIQLSVPEPGTLAGLAMALAAFGFLAAKKIRVK